MPELTAQTALRHLDAVAAKYLGTRDDHALLQQCVAVLTRLAEEHTKLTARNKVMASQIEALTRQETPEP